MSAYLVVYANISDAVGFDHYVQAVQPLIQAFGGRLIGRGVPPTSLEGHWPWQTVGLLEFPSIDAITDFWDSPEYVEIKRLREHSAQFQVIAVEGVVA